MQHGRNYEEDIPKENRDFFVKDDCTAPDQKYDDEEMEMARNMMWSDVQSLG